MKFSGNNKEVGAVITELEPRFAKFQEMMVSCANNKHNDKVASSLEHSTVMNVMSFIPEDFRDPESTKLLWMEPEMDDNDKPMIENGEKKMKENSMKRTMIEQLQKQAFDQAVKKHSTHAPKAWNRHFG